MRKKIDRFTIEQVISETSSGSVYKAQELLPGNITRPVALKVLPAMAEKDAKAEKRFASQVQLAVDLSGHPNVVAIYSMGITDRLPWLAMELVPSTLTDLAVETPGDPAQVARMMQQVASGLSALHNLTPPMLHNDLTPSNILVNKFGDCKISDFGIASPANIDRTRVIATVRYAAPELLTREFGPLSPATDLYALGHIAYELALGGKLYRQQFPAVYDPRITSREGTPGKWVAWHCSINTRPPAVHEIRKDFPPELGCIIARLMLKTATERYATADALLADLRQPPSCSNTPPSAAAGLAQPAASIPYATAITSMPPANPTPLPTASLASGPFPDPAPAAPRPGIPAFTPPSSNELYYVRLGARLTGPFDLATLQRHAKQGAISRLHQVSTDRVSWRSANTVEGLFRSSGDATQQS